MQQLAVPFLVFDITDSNTWVGATAFATLIPGMLLNPAAGVIADRVNRRLVLIITGKGRGEDGRGVIRTALPGWLETSSLRPRIVRYFEAHSSHGGAGAVYVLLKQRH